MSSQKFGATTMAKAKTKFDGEARWKAHCRRFMHSKEEQATRFNKWFNKWSTANERMRKNKKRLLFRDGNNWGQTGASKQYRNQLKHINKGCLEDPKGIESMHINLGEGDRTGLARWKEKRGTSQVESRNRMLNLLTSEVGQMLPVYMSR